MPRDFCEFRRAIPELFISLKTRSSFVAGKGEQDVYVHVGVLGQPFCDKVKCKRSSAAAGQGAEPSIGQRWLKLVFQLTNETKQNHYLHTTMRHEVETV